MRSRKFILFMSCCLFSLISLALLFSLFHNGGEEKNVEKHLHQKMVAKWELLLEHLFIEILSADENQKNPTLHEAYQDISVKSPDFDIIKFDGEEYIINFNISLIQQDHSLEKDSSFNHETPIMFVYLGSERGYLIVTANFQRNSSMTKPF